MARKKGGWFGESRRHSLASRGLKTGQKARTPRHPFIHGHPESQPEHIEEEMAEIMGIERELGHEVIKGYDYEEDTSVPFGSLPKDEDYIIMPDESLLGLTGMEWNVFRGIPEGQVVGPFNDFHRVKSAIAKQMEKERRIPRVWYMEHGLGTVPIKFGVAVRARK